MFWIASVAGTMLMIVVMMVMMVEDGDDGDDGDDAHDYGDQTTWSFLFAKQPMPYAAQNTRQAKKRRLCFCFAVVSPELF